jgi:hypothetical protein
VSKLTPEQAWQHVKALWPLADFLQKDAIGTLIRFSDASTVWESMYHIDIDWGDLTQWPPKEEWRDAVKADCFTEQVCRWRESVDHTWKTGALIGFLHVDSIVEFWVASGSTCMYRIKSGNCQVRVTAQDKTPPNADDVSANAPEREKRFTPFESRLIERVKSARNEIEQQSKEQRKKQTSKTDDTGTYGLGCERETAWRSMDSAPKDKPVWVKMGGEIVLASTDGPRIWLSHGFKKSYESDRTNQPTAWQPIQEPLP